MPPAVAPERSRSKDRHKPRASVALPPPLYRQLQVLADRNHRPLNWQLRLIVQEALKAEGLWPPPADSQADTEA